MVRRAGRHRVDEQLLDDAVTEVRRGDAPGDGVAARAAVEGDDVGLPDQPRGLDRHELRVAGADAHPTQPAAHSSSSRARALTAEAARAEPPRRPWTTSHGMPNGLSASATFDSAEPMKPTGIPTTAAGRGPPSAMVSSRWKSAVGALPIATTAPSRRSPQSETAAAD